jgi:hypothetical protein
MALDKPALESLRVERNVDAEARARVETAPAVQAAITTLAPIRRGVTNITLRR